MYQAWMCSSCKQGNTTDSDIWDCPGCGEETCERCFDRYAYCRKCAKGKTDEELKRAANAYGFDFD